MHVNSWWLLNQLDFEIETWLVLMRMNCTIILSTLCLMSNISTSVSSGRKYSGCSWLPIQRFLLLPAGKYTSNTVFIVMQEHMRWLVTWTCTLIYRQSCYTCSYVVDREEMLCIASKVAQFARHQSLSGTSCQVLHHHIMEIWLFTVLLA